METTYKPPSVGTSLTVVAEQRTRTPIYVEVCVAKKWEKAAVLGKGLVSLGAIVLDEALPGASNPKSVPLPDRVEVRIPTGEDVQFRVRSNPELVSGSALSGGMAASCTVPLTFASKLGIQYQAKWIRVSGGCELSLGSHPDQALEERKAPTFVGQMNTICGP